MAISSVTSETLQAKLRQLLPSQQGFGTDLSAQDTIVPIIDLTAAAEGSDVGQNLQTALAYGSSTTFRVTNASTVLINTPGFWQIVGTSTLESTAGGHFTSFDIDDGLAAKLVWGHEQLATANTGEFQTIQYNLVFYLNAGESINGVASTSLAVLTGSSRQIATSNGTLVNPAGFTPQ